MKNILLGFVLAISICSLSLNSFFIYQTYILSNNIVIIPNNPYLPPQPIGPHKSI